MRIILCKRHFGEHKILKEINVDCKFSDVYLGEDNINEELLLSVIPKDFLPTEPKNILLVKIDEDGGGTAQRGLNIFKNWSKYYDAYVLHIGEDKVEEQLGVLSEKHFKRYCDCMEQKDKEMALKHSLKFCSYDDAIDIVKAGEIDE